MDALLLADELADWLANSLASGLTDCLADWLQVFVKSGRTCVMEVWPWESVWELKHLIQERQGECLVPSPAVGEVHVASLQVHWVRVGIWAPRHFDCPCGVPTAANGRRRHTTARLNLISSKFFSLRGLSLRECHWVGTVACGTGWKPQPGLMRSVLGAAT
jgi:hypothetical protein